MHGYIEFSLNLLQTFSSTNVDNILRQASLQKEVYSMAMQVMQMFSEGQLKGQKPPSEQRLHGILILYNHTSREKVFKMHS